MQCLFCGSDLPEVRSAALPKRVQLAFDPLLGRLWHVCGACERWTALPLEERWEVLELCERTSERSSVLLESDHLTLLQSGKQRLIRIGRPPRHDISVWRYSALLDRFRRAGAGLRSWFSIPDRPVGGAIGRDYHGGVVTVPPAWIGSAFIDHGSVLTLLFTSVPLSKQCPACGMPLMLEPARFGNVSFERAGYAVHVSSQCALCRTAVDVPLEDARPALRTGLAVVNRKHRSVNRVRLAVEPIDRVESAHRFIEWLARRGTSLGELRPRLRLALWLALDEMAEVEALEAEWRSAEELASIADGELSPVPGFEEFKARVRRTHGPTR